MKLSTIQRLGGFSLMGGALLFAVYSALWLTILPVAEIRHDYSRMVLHPAWVWLALVAFAGVVLMMAGFAAAYSRLYAQAGAAGFAGFVTIELAYLLQACKVTWEFVVFPVIAGHAGAVALFRDGIFRNHPLVSAYRSCANLAILVGIVLFCLMLLRSREFPKAAGILVFGGALVYAAGPLVGAPIAIGGVFVIAVGCLLVGLGLVRPTATA